VSFAVVFATHDHWDDHAAFAAVIAAELRPEHVVGSMTDAVIGDGCECEGQAGVSIFAASLPDSIVEVRHLRAKSTEHGIAILGARLPNRAGRQPAPCVVMADPFTMDSKQLIEELGALGYLAVGGLTSGAGTPGEHRLLIDGRVVNEGAVVASIEPAATHVMVAQGCVPIGPEMVVTDAERNIIHQLAGRSATERLQEVLAALSPPERALASGGLLVGLVIDENRPEYRPGDYLVRGVLRADSASGDIAIGDEARIGQTLRFHVRDRSSADQDLRDALRTAPGRGDAIGGGLVFTCNGRGRSLFRENDHDAALIARELGPVPMAGMFCNGEIGPVGGVNFLHTYTATMLLFMQDSA
jgi:small ligand-binding sensory domain FIST